MSERSPEPVRPMPSAAPIFLGGAGRSGTTLLRVMLDSHPRIACGPELKIIPQWLRQWERDSRTFGDHAAEHRGIGAGAIDDAYRAKVSMVLTRVRQRSGKPRLAEKTPNNVFFFGHLHRLFPDSPLIHVIRDGRDVVASLLGVEWFHPDGKRVPYTENAAAAAKYWADAVGSGLKARKHLGGKAVLEVRYENLVRETEAEMRRVLDHLEEPWDEVVLRHWEEPHDLGLETSADQVTRPVYTSSIGRWRERLSKGDLSTVEGICGALLVELGYH